MNIYAFMVFAPGPECVPNVCRHQNPRETRAIALLGTLRGRHCICFQDLKRSQVVIIFLYTYRTIEVIERFNYIGHRVFYSIEHTNFYLKEQIEWSNILKNIR